jgi:flagellar FliJ protein
VFKFRFKVLLQARRSAEDVLQKELAEARRALAAEQAAFRELRTNQRRCLRELHRIQQQSFQSADVQLYERYLTRLERDIHRQQKRTVSAEHKMLQKRNALIEAVKKRKVLDTLHDKDLRAYLNAVEFNERKFMDDVATQRFSNSSTQRRGVGEPLGENPAASRKKLPADDRHH